MIIKSIANLYAYPENKITVIEYRIQVIKKINGCSTQPHPLLVLLSDDGIFIVYHKIRTAFNTAAYISLGIVHIHINDALAFAGIFIVFVVKTIFTHFQLKHFLSVTL